MKIVDINPHVRFAEQITYSEKHSTVFVKDYRLIYILNGEGQILIDGTAHPLTSDTLFYCPGGTRYTIEPEDALGLYVLNFDLTQRYSHLTTSLSMKFDGAKHQEALDKVIVDDSNVMNSFMILKNATAFKYLLGDIIYEFAAQKIFFRENCSSMLKSTIIEIHRMNTGIPDSSSGTINKLISYINSNFRREIRNSELAELAGYHEYYLNRLFVSQTGISMHKYILLLRINESKKLLLNTNLPISDIAEKTGFNSATHFSTYFRKETNMSPLKYRSNLKNNV